jgi:tetratricopeptide (TPR) repeat protein
MRKQRYNRPNSDLNISHPSTAGSGWPSKVVVVIKAPWRAILLTAVASLLGAGAGAQTLPVQPRAQSTPTAAPSDTDRQIYDVAFQETLRKPADPTTLVAFAEIAIKIGDLEGAISALDRLLLIDGDQPEVKLELGVLYFRLGSFEAARGYLEEARASGRASAALKERATAFLKEVK